MNLLSKLPTDKLLYFAKKIVPIIFYAALVVFLYFYLKSIDFERLKDLQVDWLFVALSTIFGLAFRYWGAYIWLVLLKGLGAKNLTNKTQLLYVYAKSWLGRYIPGTAPWILGKIYFASKQGISKNKLAVSSLLEGGLQVNVVLILSLLILSFDSRLNIIDIRFKFLMIAIAVVGIISLTPRVFNKIVSITYKLLKKKTLDEEHLANGKTIMTGAGLYAVGAVISGVSFFYMAKAVFPDLLYSDALFVIGTASLAGAVSMLAVFTPSGLGVREGIQLALLSLIMPTELALVVTVFTRLWSIVTDLLFFGLAILTKNRSPIKDD